MAILWFFLEEKIVSRLEGDLHPHRKRVPEQQRKFSGRNNGSPAKNSDHFVKNQSGYWVIRSFSDVEL
jgi:tyrosine-protein phosphatase YwqE